MNHHEHYVYKSKISRVMTKPVLGFPTRSDTNRAVQPQKLVRGSKFRIQEVEGLYYLRSENKGADGNREADLRLFSYMQKAGFLTTRLI